MLAKGIFIYLIYTLKIIKKCWKLYFFYLIQNEIDLLVNCIWIIVNVGVLILSAQDNAYDFFSVHCEIAVRIWDLAPCQLSMRVRVLAGELLNVLWLGASEANCF